MFKGGLGTSSEEFLQVLWDDSPSGVGLLLHTVQPMAKWEQSGVQDPGVSRVLGGKGGLEALKRGPG